MASWVCVKRLFFFVFVSFNCILLLPISYFYSFLQGRKVLENDGSGRGLKILNVTIKRILGGFISFCFCCWRPGAVWRVDPRSVRRTRTSSCPRAWGFGSCTSACRRPTSWHLRYQTHRSSLARKIASPIVVSQRTHNRPQRPTKYKYNYVRHFFLLIFYLWLLKVGCQMLPDVHDI